MKNKTLVLIPIFVFCFLFFSLHLNASEADIKLVKEQYGKNKLEKNSKVRFKPAGKEGSVFRYNPLSILAGTALYIYQGIITKHYASQCIHLPSCSEYAKQSIQKKGLISGIILTADRLSRCNHRAAKDVPWFNYSGEKIVESD